MIRQSIDPKTRIGLGAFSILVVLAGYSWLSYRQHEVNPNDTTIPNLGQFVEGWHQVTKPKGILYQEDAAGGFAGFRTSHLWSDAKATFGRLLAGVLWGVGLSILFGLAMGCLAPVEAFCIPPLSFFAKIPPTAMLAVYFVVFGMGFKMYVAMVALGIFPTLAQSIYQAVKKDVTDHAINKAYTLGASHVEVVWNVILRQILPRIIENVRLQIGPAMVFLIAAEFAIGSEGFGYKLRLESRKTNMSVVYIYLVILGAIGFMIDLTLSALRRKLSPWFGE